MKVIFVVAIEGAGIVWLEGLRLKFTHTAQPEIVQCAIRAEVFDLSSTTYWWQGFEALSGDCAFCEGDAFWR